MHDDFIGTAPGADENQEMMMSNDTNDTEGHGLKAKMEEAGDDAEGHILPKK